MVKKSKPNLKQPNEDKIKPRSRLESLRKDIMVNVLPEFLNQKEKFNLLFLNKKIRLKLKKSKIHDDFKHYKMICKSNYFCNCENHCKNSCTLENHSSECILDKDVKCISKKSKKNGKRCISCKDKFCSNCFMNCEMRIKNCDECQTKNENFCWKCILNGKMKSTRCICCTKDLCKQCLLEHGLNYLMC